MGFYIRSSLNVSTFDVYFLVLTWTSGLSLRLKTLTIPLILLIWILIYLIFLSTLVNLYSLVYCTLSLDYIGRDSLRIWNLFSE